MSEVKEMTQANQDNKYVINVALKEPVEIDGNKIDTIILDFSNFTGEDILKVDEELRIEGKIFDNIFNQHAMLLLAAKAAKMNPYDLKKLKAGDYLEVVFQTRNFFVRW